MFPVLLSVSFLRSISFTNFTNLKLHLLSDSPTPPPLTHLITASSISGAVTGSVIALLNSPFEYIKIQRQSQKSNRKSSIHYFTQILKSRGVKGLYNGVHLHVLRDGLGTCLYFTGYETLKHLLTNKTDLNHGLASLLSGGVSGTCCWLFLFPIDLVKTIIQRESLALKPMYTSSIAFIRDTVKREGVWRFYRGITPTLVRSFPVHAVNFFVYEKVLAFCDRIKVI